MGEKKIVFVYNADSGIFDTVSDYFQKMISPSTYSCNLCAVTYGNLGMKGKWKDFIKELPITSEFLHRDEFFEQYDMENVSLPCAFLKTDGDMELFITSEEINGCSSLEELIELVTKKVDELDA
jgi:hypothetical protein